MLATSWYWRWNLPRMSYCTKLNEIQWDCSINAFNKLIVKILKLLPLSPRTNVAFGVNRQESLDTIWSNFSRKTMMCRLLSTNQYYSNCHQRRYKTFLLRSLFILTVLIYPARCTCNKTNHEEMKFFNLLFVIPWIRLFDRLWISENSILFINLSF